MSEYRIFVGNPGTGKSTMLNGLFQQLRFKSGISLGTGLTTHLQLEQFSEHLYYGDTPGLNDIETRKRAAEEIGNALKKDGYYKLFFVITIESGRIRPADATTISLVLQAVDVNVPFGIIINKLSKNILKELNDNPSGLQKIAAGLFGTSGRVNEHIFLMDFDPELFDTNNVVPSRNEKLSDFVDMVPYLEVKPAQVKTIRINEFEEIQEQLQKRIDEMEANKTLLERTLQEMREAAQRVAEEFKRAMTETEERNKRNLEALELKRRQEMKAMQDAHIFLMEARHNSQIQAELNRRKAEAAAALERARIEQERVRGLEIISRVPETQKVDTGGPYRVETGRKTRWHRFGYRDSVWYDDRQNSFVQTRERITRRNGTVEYTPWGNTGSETRVVNSGMYHC